MKSLLFVLSLIIVVKATHEPCGENCTWTFDEQTGLLEISSVFITQIKTCYQKKEIFQEKNFF